MGGVGFAAGVAPLWVINNSGLQSFGVYLLCGAILPILITLGINKLLYDVKSDKGWGYGSKNKLSKYSILK